MTLDDHVDATKDKITGGIQEAVGEATGDKETEGKGAIKKAFGEVKEKLADAKDAVEDKAGEVAADIKDKFDKDDE